MTPITVLIPVYDAADTLGRAIQAARAQLGPDDELLVVDDGSTDGSAEVARAAGATVIVLPHNRGVAAARNIGVAAARHGWILFTDADAELGPGVVDRLRAWAASPGDERARVGVYSARSGLDVVSRHKHLWIRYTYLSAGRQIDWLFGCATLIHRDTVQAAGGFAEGLQRRSGGSDVELGLRLAAAGHRIVLDPDFEVIHHRTFTTAELFANDYHRAAGYVRIGLSRLEARDVLRPRRFGNIPVWFVVSVLALGAALVAGVLAPWVGPVPLLLATALWWAACLPFLGWAARVAGLRYALAGVGLLGVSGVACLVGLGVGVLRAQQA